MAYELYLYYLYAKLRHYYQYYYSITLDNFDPNMIIDNIYVGSIYDAYNIEKLEEEGITNVISAVAGFDNIYDSTINHLNLTLIDNNQQDILRYFEISNHFIEQILEKNEKILVHCICGVSRSVTLVCAYMIKKYNYTVKEALEIIKKNRNVANPNENFINQLEEYYQLLNRK